MKYLTICAIFKYEEPYIRDWITYHKSLGVEHFYLYDNESPDKSTHIAESFGPELVTVEPVYGHPAQPLAYARCLQKYKKDSRWIAFIDVDEYIVVKDGLSLVDLLRQYETFPCLCPHWRLFGSNGREEFDPAPVPELYTRSQQDVNVHVKSIVNPMRTFSWVNAHRFYHDTSPVDEKGTPIEMTDATPPNPTGDKIYIAHYVTKSKAECFERRARRRADTDQYRYNVKEFWEGHDRNDVENLDVLNLWRKIDDNNK